MCIFVICLPLNLQALRKAYRCPRSTAKCVKDSEANSELQQARECNPWFLNKNLNKLS
jgi:hypothetical protein